MDSNILALKAPQEMSSVVGPGFIVVILNSGLLGVLSVQVFLYYLAFPNDQLYMKCLVYGIYILEAVQSAVFTRSGFQKFVIKLGNVEGFNQVEKGEWLNASLIAIGTFFAQGFYAHRIKNLAQSKKVAGVIIALSFVQLVGGIATGVNLGRKKYYTMLVGSKLTAFQWCTTAMWNIGSVLCDIVIAVCMTYYLSRYDTGIKKTKVILKKVIRLTIETGSLTAIVGILSFSLAIFPGSSYYEVPMCIIGKVYANSMLILINSRVVFGSEETQTPSPVISVLRFGAAPPNPEDSARDADNADKGDMGIDTRSGAGPSASSQPEAV